MKNVTCAQGIDRANLPHRNRCSTLTIDKSDTAGTSCYRDLPNPARPEIIEDVFNIATSRRPVILRANRNIDESQQLAHPLLPTSAIEHNRNPTLVGRSRRCNTQRHVMPVNLHNRHPAQPSRTELCRERRKHGCICRHHRPIACPAKNHDRRNRRRLRSLASKIVQCDREALHIAPNDRAQRMPAHRRPATPVRQETQTSLPHSPTARPPTTAAPSPRSSGCAAESRRPYS